MDEALIQRVQNQIFKFEANLSSTGDGDASFTLDYDDKEYRQSDLVGLIRDVVPYFSLTEDELITLGKSDWYQTSFTRISDAQEDKKGDYGELILFLLLTRFYDCPKFVTKARLRSTNKEQIKGFDCAHFTIDHDQEVSLWLGEAKFYKNFSDAASKALSSLKDHLTDSKKIKDELKLLGGNIEINKELDEDTYIALKSYVSGGKSLDKVKICVPVLITYDSATIKHFNGSLTADINADDFKKMFKAELTKHYTLIYKKNWPESRNIKIVFFLMPFLCVTEIKENLAIVEQGMRF